MFDRIPVYIAPNIGWAINLFISYPEMPLILSKDNAKFWLSEWRENLFSIQGLEKRRWAEKSKDRTGCFGQKNTAWTCAAGWERKQSRKQRSNK